MCGDCYTVVGYHRLFRNVRGAWMRDTITGDWPTKHGAGRFEIITILCRCTHNRRRQRMLSLSKVIVVNNIHIRLLRTGSVMGGKIGRTVLRGRSTYAPTLIESLAPSLTPPPQPPPGGYPAFSGRRGPFRII